jgi:hypothetical protein
MGGLTEAAAQDHVSQVDCPADSDHRARIRSAAIANGASKRCRGKGQLWFQNSDLRNGDDDDEAQLVPTYVQVQQQLNS